MKSIRRIMVLTGDHGLPDATKRDARYNAEDMATHDAMMRAFDQRRRVIVEGLNRIPGFSCSMPRGAFYAFPNVTGTGIGSKELEERLLLDAGVAVLSGTSFGRYGEGYLRFSYAAGTESIQEGLRRVRSCLQPA